jgi:hypothetical protein
VFLDGEAQLQVDRWGLGAGASLQYYSLQRDTAAAADAQSDKLRALVMIAVGQLSRALFDGQLVVGVGLRPTALNVVNLNPRAGQPRTLFTTEGFGYSAGFLWRPNERSFRIGASFNTAVKTQAKNTETGIQDDGNGNRIIAPGTADQMYLPERVCLPWDLDLGIAIQLGARPFNPRWLSPQDLLLPIRQRIEWRQIERELKRERLLTAASTDPEEQERLTARLDEDEAAATKEDKAELAREKELIDKMIAERVKRLARGYVLLSTSLRISGSVDNAVGVESFLQRRVDRSGRRTVVSPHVGIESEVISNWLKLRAGLYGEPTRFDNANASPRLHTTLGFEQKVLPWTVFGLFEEGTAWRIQAAVDVSTRYFGWAASIGRWR